MSPNIRSARKKLSYPLYGADFDPSNQDFLLVGGGGGSTSAGVPNKISLVDASRFDSLNEIADLELAKDEDSVTSLAIANSDLTSLTAYAGINSSVKEQEAGRNEHFRSFRIGLPTRKRTADGSEKPGSGAATETVRTQALTRAALFKSATGGPKSEAYQRVLRVSPAHKEGGDRLVAISSGLAEKNEVLVLQATQSPTTRNVISRIDIEKGEAADLDIVPVEGESTSHALAYCTDYEVFLQHIPSSSSSSVAEPVKVYETASSGRRIKIRSLRWLNSRYLLLLRNRPGGTGSDLAILKTDKSYTQAQDVLEKRLTKSTKQAVGLTTCALSPSPKDEQQFLVAIAGQDSSIEILSIDWVPGSGMTKFKQYAHLRDVHSGPITRITFSNFHPPPTPVTKETKPQYVKLASVGIDLNVVVHTLPLRPYPATYTKNPRYVLIPPPETLQNTINIFTALLIVSLVAFCMQVFCEIRGAVPPTLHAQSWLSPKWQARIATPYIYASGHPHNAMPGPVIPESMPPVVSSVLNTATDTAEAIIDNVAPNFLVDLVTEQKTNPEMQHKELVIRDEEGTDGLSTNFHHRDSDAVKDATVKKWEDLTESERKGWKKRLVNAGKWTEKQGETILKGILFSELAGAVGAAVRG